MKFYSINTFGVFVFVVVIFISFQNCSPGFKSSEFEHTSPNSTALGSSPSETTTPVVAFTQTPSASTTLTTDTISFSATNVGSGIDSFLCSLDNAAFAKCTSPLGLIVSIGSHNFRVQAIDTAGSRSNIVAFSWDVFAVLSPPVGGSTKIGWVPCAVRGEMCKFSGSRRVLFGLTPESKNVVKTVSNGVLCDTASFGGVNPSGEDDDYCWYEGDVPVVTSSVTITGPSIDITKISPAFPGSEADRLKDSAGYQPPNASDVGAFREPCMFSHFAFDDPLVYPNQPGKAHLHVFFGNTGANAYSTVDSIANSGTTTCKGGLNNRSAYWVPAMIDTKDGAPVRPAAINTYYKSGYNGITPDKIKVVPTGLRMIAGTASNSSSGVNPVRYACVGPVSTGAQGWFDNITDANCAVGNFLDMNIAFPQCWDGVHLDSDNHKSHMSDTVDGKCPASHPVPIPEIEYNVRYVITEANSVPRWRLSSDNYSANIKAGYSGHGDYFFGWKPSIAETFVKFCVVPSIDCHEQLIGNGQVLY